MADDTRECDLTFRQAVVRESALRGVITAALQDEEMQVVFLTQEAYVKQDELTKLIADLPRVHGSSGVFMTPPLIPSRLGKIAAMLFDKGKIRAQDFANSLGLGLCGLSANDAWVIVPWVREEDERAKDLDKALRDIRDWLCWSPSNN